MNNIEKLAGNCGEYVNGEYFVFYPNELEAFAKSLQQSSEPVALPTFNELSKNIDDSRFVGHPKLSALDTNNVKTGARIMYDAIYVWLKKQNTSSVPLEKYNKLLDALKALEFHTKDNNIKAREVAHQAIAEAEGKEG